VREQRGLCCYCMKMIRAAHGAMKIEHWHSQTGHRDEQLRYTNLLGACMEVKNAFCWPALRHTKGDLELSRNPPTGCIASRN